AGAPEATAAGKKPSMDQVLKTILVRVPPQVLTSYWQKNYLGPYIRQPSDDWDVDNPLYVGFLGDIDNDSNIDLVFAGRGTGVPGKVNINSVASSPDGWSLASFSYHGLARRLYEYRRDERGAPNGSMGHVAAEFVPVQRSAAARFPRASTGLPLLWNGMNEDR